MSVPPVRSRSFMVDPYPDPSHPLPRPILAGAVALAVAVVAMVAIAHGTGVGTFHHPEPVAVASRDLRFVDAPDGSVTVQAAGSGEAVARIEPETGGFLRAALRGLGRNRQRHSDPEDAPYRLGAGPDGQVWLTDLATNQSIDLRAFGQANAEAFAAFLRPGTGAP